jgi:tripartite-type tricarboxylate transporter receptor subunit TctC
VMPNLPFNPGKSFTGVAMLGKAPLMLAASKRVPAKNTRELLDLARAKPGHLNYGSAGLGSVNHMSMELLKYLAGLDIKHVPYRAGSLAVNDLIGGHLDMFIGSMPQMMELVRADTATGIAITGTERSPAVPEPGGRARDTVASRGARSASCRRASTLDRYRQNHGDSERVKQLRQRA